MTDKPAIPPEIIERALDAYFEAMPNGYSVDKKALTAALEAVGYQELRGALEGIMKYQITNPWEDGRSKYSLREFTEDVEKARAALAIGRGEKK